VSYREFLESKKKPPELIGPAVEAGDCNPTLFDWRTACSNMREAENLARQGQLFGDVS